MCHEGVICTKARSILVIELCPRKLRAARLNWRLRTWNIRVPHGGITPPALWTYTRKVRIGLISAKTRPGDQGIVRTHQELLICILMDRNVENEECGNMAWDPDGLPPTSLNPNVPKTKTTPTTRSSCGSSVDSRNFCPWLTPMPYPVKTNIQVEYPA